MWTKGTEKLSNMPKVTQEEAGSAPDPRQRGSEACALNHAPCCSRTYRIHRILLCTDPEIGLLDHMVGRFKPRGDRVNNAICV